MQDFAKREWLHDRKKAKNVFIGGVVTGVAIGFALGILAAAIYIHLVIFPIIL